MYSTELSHYRAPDTTNVTWFTPQQVDAVRNRVREDEKLHRPPVKVREVAPVVRAATPDEDAELRNIMAAAPQIMAQAIKSGAAQVHPQPPITGRVAKLTPGKHRRPWSLARRRAAAARRRGMKYRKHSTLTVQPSTR